MNRSNPSKSTCLQIASASFALLLACSLLRTPALAATGINHQINFQGKLVNTDGTNVADSTYTIVFSLYTVSSGGSNIWTETDSVTTKDGVFQVPLGAVTTLPGSVNFDTDSLYLGIKVGSDSEMTPRVRFAAVPYAFNAETVNGLAVTNNDGNTLNIAANKTLTASNSLTLAGTDGKTFTINNSLTFNGTDGNSFTFPNASGSTVCVSGQTCATSGTVGYFQRNASGGLNYLAPATLADLLSIGQTTGLSNAGLSVKVNSLGNAAAYVENSGGQGDIFTASSAGAPKFVIDKNGNVGIGTTIPGAKLVVGSVAFTTTPAYIFLNDISNSANGNASFVGNWNSSALWGIGPATNSGSDNTLRIGNISGGGTSPTNTWAGTQNLSLLIGGTVGNSALKNSGLDIETNGLGNSVLVANNSGGAGDIFTASSAGSPKFVINSAGNVGIGTTTPRASLDLASGTMQGAGLSSDCSGTSSKLLWSSSSKQFSCGNDKPSVMIIKSADQTVNNSTTLVNDNDFSWSIGANENWIYEMALTLNSNSTANFKETFTAPSGATCALNESKAGGSGNDISNVACGTSTLINGTGADQSAWLSGTINNGASSGTVQFQWAQNTANASNTIVRGKASWLLAYKTTGADYAETYYTNDTSVQSGDVVSIDGTLKSGFKKSQGKYDKDLMGVVSTQPGEVVGDAGDGGIPMPIALQGRVPVKVNLEGGLIQPGDPLTSSSTPGVAMKATQAGPIIGKALTAFDRSMGTEGMVIMFMQVGYNNPVTAGIISKTELALSALPGLTIATGNDDEKGKQILSLLASNQSAITPQSDTVSLFGDQIFAGTIFADSIKANHIEGLEVVTNELDQIATSDAQWQAQVASLSGQLTNLSQRVALLENHLPSLSASATAALSSDDATVSGALSVAGRTILADVGVTGKLTSGLLTIDGLDTTQGTSSASINTLAGPLKLQSLALGGLDLLNGKVTIDTNGNVTIAETLTAKKYMIDTHDTLRASAGKADIPAGKTFIDIQTSALTQQSLIFATPVSTPSAVSTSILGPDTFEIRIKDAPSTDVQVNWWVVN